MPLKNNKTWWDRTNNKTKMNKSNKVEFKPNLIQTQTYFPLWC
jgi:hypothetical protein